MAVEPRQRIETGRPGVTGPVRAGNRLRRRWFVVAAVTAFMAVDLVLVVLALRSTRAPVPPPSTEPAVTVTQTVIGHQDATTIEGRQTP